MTRVFQLGIALILLGFAIAYFSEPSLPEGAMRLDDGTILDDGFNPNVERQFTVADLTTWCQWQSIKKGSMKRLTDELGVDAYEGFQPGDIITLRGDQRLMVDISGARSEDPQMLEPLAGPRRVTVKDRFRTGDVVWYKADWRERGREIAFNSLQLMPLMTENDIQRHKEAFNSRASLISTDVFNAVERKIGPGGHFKMSMATNSRSCDHPSLPSFD